MFKKFVSWLLVSSEDPQKVSLSVKGFFIAAIPYIMDASNLFHLNISNDMLNSITGDITAWIAGVLTVVGYSIAIYGAGRKLINTHLIEDPVPASIVEETVTNGPVTKVTTTTV